MMKQADWIIDIDPDGGKNGGQMVFTGTPAEMLRGAHTLTADSLHSSVMDSVEHRQQTINIS